MGSFHLVEASFQFDHIMLFWVRRREEEQQVGITLLILVIVLMIAFVGTSFIIANLQKNKTDSPGELQSHILQEFKKTEKPPK